MKRPMSPSLLLHLSAPRQVINGLVCLAFSLVGWFGIAPPVAYSEALSPAENTPASILNPQKPNRPEYRFHIDAVDPSAASYPKGVGFPGFRGEQQLIIYTPAYGRTTGTNAAGLEIIVQEGVITQVNDAGNSVIPANGLVVSGHGSAANWLARFGQVGAVVQLESTKAIPLATPSPSTVSAPNPDSAPNADITTGAAEVAAPITPPPDQVMIRLTPAVFQHQIEAALRLAQSRPAVNEAHYQAALQQAQTCQTDVLSMGNDTATPALMERAQQCVNLAQVAFYNTIANQPNEFRGAWLRPTSAKPEDVRRVIESLQQAHIHQIFLETYYQGKTTYLSSVMAQMGLKQHPQFVGSDPVKVWVEEAHRAGLKINLWAQVFFAGNQNENAEQFGPILTVYPQWRNIQRMNLNAGVPMPSQIEPGHYFLDPANPQVRDYLQKLLLEMVSQYDIDGLNLDYIRYPASAASNRGNYLETTWGYTESARQQFRSLMEQERLAAAAECLKKDPTNKTALGKATPKVSTSGKPIGKVTPSASTDPKDLTPNSPLWPSWVAWRKGQVTSFVQEISQKAHAIKPTLLISAVIFPSMDPVYAQKLQDYPRWASEGYIQALTPIGFSTIPARLQWQATQLRAQIQDKVPVYAGIFGMYNRNHPVELVRQIDAAHQAGVGGIVLFDWSRLNADYDTALKEGPFRE